MKPARLARLERNLSGIDGKIAELEQLGNPIGFDALSYYHRLRAMVAADIALIRERQGDAA